MIKRAVISVYDKQGLETLVKALEKYSVQIISSGGTARRIKEIGYKELIEVSDYTGHPESPEGLVKTLHPKIHGGLLLNRNQAKHAKWMKENKIEPIDLVVVNLYPFEKVVQGGADLEKAGHNIDIGGPTMIRSAAKASLLYDNTCVVSDPEQYTEIFKNLEKNNGKLTTKLKQRYAILAFRRTMKYDATIVEYLEDTL
jgi:phosphoribosylaminoimidazolecarboxamide formyltransferase/IMP cyclohydrolase